MQNGERITGSDSAQNCSPAKPQRLFSPHAHFKLSLSRAVNESELPLCYFHLGDRGSIQKFQLNDPTKHWRTRIDEHRQTTEISFAWPRQPTTMLAKAFLWIRGIISFLYMMLGTAVYVNFRFWNVRKRENWTRTSFSHHLSLRFKYGAPTNKYLEMDKPVFVPKTFKELHQWDFSVGISSGSLRRGMNVPEHLQAFQLAEKKQNSLVSFLSSLYVPGTSFLRCTKTNFDRNFAIF